MAKEQVGSDITLSEREERVLGKLRAKAKPSARREGWLELLPEGGLIPQIVKVMRFSPNQAGSIQQSLRRKGVIEFVKTEGRPWPVLIAAGETAPAETAETTPETTELTDEVARQLSERLRAEASQLRSDADQRDELAAELENAPRYIRAPAPLLAKYAAE